MTTCYIPTLIPSVATHESQEHLNAFATAIAQGYPHTQLNADGTKITRFAYLLPPVAVEGFPVGLSCEVYEAPPSLLLAA